MNCIYIDYDSAQSHIEAAIAVLGNEGEAVESLYEALDALAEAEAFDEVSAS